MVLGLDKLFGSKAPAPAPAPSPAPAPAQAPSAAVPQDKPQASVTASAFIRREPVFDAQRCLAGHFYRLQQKESGPSNGRFPQSKAIDQVLLKSLCSSGREEGWGRLLAFVPICSDSLENPWLAKLPTENTILVVELTPDADPVTLAERLAKLKEGGFRLSVLRQPKHPAFPAALPYAEFPAIDVAASQGGNVRDFSIALRSKEVDHKVSLLAANIETMDDFNLCRQWQFEYFHGPFAAAKGADEGHRGDPHKLNLLYLFNLVQSDAENTEVVANLKQDPYLTFRILRYLNSAAVALSRPVDSMDHALMLLGRQRLSRWLSVLLFSVKNPDFADWLLVEYSLGRGRIMELLGAKFFPASEADQLFLTGVFSRLDKLLRMPLAEAMGQMKLQPNVRDAILNRSGPYAPLLAVAEACEAFDPPRMEAAARAAGLDPDTVNRALLDATTWTSTITENWA